MLHIVMYLIIAIEILFQQCSEAKTRLNMTVTDVCTYICFLLQESRLCNAMHFARRCF